MSINNVNQQPKSAYPKIFRDRFDSSVNLDDSAEGDISLARSEFQIDEDDEESNDFNYNTNKDDDDSFEDLLDSPVASRKPSIFKEPISLKPHGYEFKLKKSGALVYLTYPINSVDIDTYGRIEYELETKDKSMVIIIPNSKGLSINNQKLADAYAIRTGCVTAILDVYFEDALHTESLQEMETGSHDDSFISKFKNMAIEAAINLKVNYWLKTHAIFGAYNEEDRRFQSTSSWLDVEFAIEELLTKHEVENSVIIGYSFGANTAARIAIESKDERINSTVLVHPIFLPKTALEFIKKPTLLIVGRPDEFYNQDDLDKFERDLQAKKNIDNFKFTQLKLKRETPHGFAIAGDYSPMKIGDLPTQTSKHIVSWVLKKI